MQRYEDERFEDYYFEFNQKENAGIMELDTDKGFFTGNTVEFFNISNRFVDAGDHMVFPI